LDQVIKSIDQGAGSRARGDDTRRRLVASAERLFGEHGIDGVSLRAINADAEVGPAAVHYHFGSKGGLVEAVVRERAIPVLDRVREHIEYLAARPQPASAQELVEVIAGPYLELLASHPVGGLRWVKIVAQLAMADTDVIGRVTAEIGPALLEQVTRVFPRVEPSTLRIRWGLTVQTLIQMLSQLDDDGIAEGRYRRYVSELTAFAAGGLDAVRADTLRGSDLVLSQSPGQ
jgi:AcrR family transcriptional regulator